MGEEWRIPWKNETTIFLISALVKTHNRGLEHDTFCLAFLVHNDTLAYGNHSMYSSAQRLLLF